MGNDVFPVLPGLKWGMTRSPVWSTRIQRSVSGRELRAAYYSYPIWRFSLAYELLRSGALAELQQLVGFFNARQGSFDSFLYEAPDDRTVTNQAFGVVAAGRTQYPLVRTFGGCTEPVTAVKGAPVITAGGVAMVAGSDYAISATGVVTVAKALAAGTPLAWTGGFYHRCRFVQDTTEFEQFMHQLWSAKKIEFQTVKP